MRLRLAETRLNYLDSVLGMLIFAAKIFLTRIVLMRSGGAGGSSASAIGRLCRAERGERRGRGAQERPGCADGEPNANDKIISHTNIVVHVWLVMHSCAFVGIVLNSS